MERGIRVGTGRHVFQKELTGLTTKGNVDLSRRMLMLLSDMASELDVINERIAAIDAEVNALAKADADMQRLMEIPGVGPTVPTALVAAVGTGSSFVKGRDLAAWLGLVPRQITGSARIDREDHAHARPETPRNLRHAARGTEHDPDGNPLERLRKQTLPAGFARGLVGNDGCGGRI